MDVINLLRGTNLQNIPIPAWRNLPQMDAVSRTKVQRRHELHPRWRTAAEELLAAPRSVTQVRTEPHPKIHRIRHPTIRPQSTLRLPKPKSQPAVRRAVKVFRSQQPQRFQLRYPLVHLTTPRMGASRWT
uniref:(northern house mosquito) hypothetical protein n=1 Tax=Culex pipiens TaxID=7175 RepID=A0A8D8DVH3_CULPI